MLTSRRLTTLSPRLAITSVVALGLSSTLLAQPPGAVGQPEATAGADARAAAGPNVLVVTVDDMEVSDLGRMPQLKKLVAQGLHVEQGIAPTPICAPSRASMLTGQYAHHHGVRTISGPYGGFDAFDDAATLPGWLREAGYTTHFAGKYLNGYEKPGQRYVPPGWTDWYGSSSGTYSFFNTTFNDNGRRQVHTTRHNSDVVGDHGVDLIESRRKARKPWFAWLNFTAPHHGGPRESDDPAGVKTTAPAKRHRNAFAKATLPDVPEMLRGGGSPWAGPTTPPRRRAAWREAYQQRAESLLSVDEAVGRLVGALRRTGQWRNTYVVFTSDNGFLVGHHNRFGKLVPYDRSLRVPFYVVGPRIPRGTSRTTATVADLPVTIAAMAGARPSRDVDGVNLLPSWRSGKTYRRPIPVEGYPVSNGTRRMYSGIRYGAYTFARHADGTEVLFDRSRDPGELRNVVGEPRYRDLAQRLREMNTRYADCRGATCPRAESFELVG